MESTARHALGVLCAALVCSSLVGPEAEAQATTDLEGAAVEVAAPNSEPSESRQDGAGAWIRLPTGIALGGYVEALYSYNFGRPSNGITNARGFDNRHDSFSLANVALDVSVDRADVLARLTLQVGHTPSTYYGAEPSLPGTPTANASSAELWKFVQQAYAGHRFGRRHETTVLAGVFLSPIGPETMAIRENWNWSRSNLFFGLPFYHAGARVRVALDERWSLTVHAYNGWNSIVDANGGKTLMAQANYANSRGFAVSLLYSTGVERPDGSPEGRRFRHLFDAYASLPVGDRFELGVHGNTGFEPTRFGTGAWLAGAAYGRVEVLPDALFFAARIDAFREWVADDTVGSATPIFWPVAWVSSSTLTLDYRPHRAVSFRLEGRHDQAAGALYFGGAVTGDGSATMPFVPNRRGQTTLLAGVVAGF